MKVKILKPTTLLQKDETFKTFKENEVIELPSKQAKSLVADERAKLIKEKLED